MLNSMTGYNRVKHESEHWTVTVDIRAVNHRYLDAAIKVPRIYAFLEEPVKKRLAKCVSRGKVDIYISVAAKDGEDVRITPNLAVADAYMAAAEALAARYGIERDVTAFSLLRLPEVMAVDKEDADSEQLTGEVMAVFEDALKGFCEMRAREGEQLCGDVIYRIGLIEKLADSIEKRSPDSTEEFRERIAQRMLELFGEGEVAQQRILSEAAAYADKVNVTEELVRLRSHLNQLRLLLSSEAAVGKKIDFIVQEMNREANTIGSKANDYEVTKTVVELKAEIEKIREQIQNLE